MLFPVQLHKPGCVFTAVHATGSEEGFGWNASLLACQFCDLPEHIIFWSGLTDVLHDGAGLISLITPLSRDVA